MNNLLAQAPVNIGSSFQSPFGVSKTVADLISLIVTGAISLAGVFFLFLLLAGGFMIISSAGSDNPQGAANGKQAVTSALFGFIIVVTAFFIVKAIELMFGVTLLSFP